MGPGWGIDTFGMLAGEDLVVSEPTICGMGTTVHPVAA